MTKTENIEQRKIVDFRIGEDLNQHEVYKYEREKIESMRDPFMFLTCKKCGAVEGLPIDQQRSYFGCFSVEYITKPSPDGAFYKCKNCESPQHVFVDMDEGTEPDGYDD